MITDKRIIELWNAASNAATSKLDWTYSEIIFATVRAVIAEHDAELRKQEPVAYTFKQEGSPAYTNNPSFMKLNTQYVYEPLYAAPIPPDNHDWKAEYLRQVDLHNQTLDELREAEMQLRNPAPTPPTPSQQELKHPTYGTIENLMNEIVKDVKQGYEVRLGMLGAINWFSCKFGELRARPDEVTK